MSVDIQNLTFRYGTRRVLDDVSFLAETGEVTSVLGPNGVGKSTLFRCILGLLRNREGQIRLDGADARGLSPRKMAERVAFIPQAHAPVFNFTVFEVVLMGTSARLSAAAVPGRPEKERAERALESVGIPELAARSYCRISGGELQLVLIARALAQDARILVLDEPTANLDFGNQLRVLSKLRDLARQGYTIVQATHNPDQGFLYSDRVVALSAGRVLADGPPSQLVTSELMNALYRVDVAVESLYGDRVRVLIPRSVIAG